MWKTINKNALVLSIFALFCLLVIVAVQLATKDKIAQELQKAEFKNFSEIFAPLDINSEIVKLHCYLVSNEKWLGTTENQKTYVVEVQNKVIGTFINSVATDGYNGSIFFSVGLDDANTIKGLRIISHKETPGLGDKIDIAKSNWVLSFNNKAIAQNVDWNVKKQGGDFDAFTGATITPKAVIKAMERTLKHIPSLQEIKANYPKCGN